VRVIYKYALEQLSSEHTKQLFQQYSLFEKKFGDRVGIEDIVISKRKYQYEEQLKTNAHNYDIWFDYIRLMEGEQDMESTRKIYERAIANIPPKKEKRFWRRYIYLWISYALFEELDAKDIDRAREVYQFCLKLLPHKTFTFAKFWILAAKFEIRQKNLNSARKLLGTAIGLCPKDKLFREYIELEIQLREFDRCRLLYQKFLEFSPQNCTVWMKFAELETILGEVDRGRAIYEIAIDQSRLDMPEVIWKSYIDFEVEQQESERARMLYERLLERTQHVKVWISFARFEFQGSDGSDSGIAQTRTVFERANKALKNCEEKESRLMLLEAWHEFEHQYGTDSTRDAVNRQMPKKVKKRRKMQTNDGSDAGWEEYYDYIFPTDEEALPHLRFLEMAKKWKQSQQESVQ